MAILGGWWLLLANNAFIAAVIYGALWAVFVLIVTVIVLKIGFGYNRMQARKSKLTDTQWQSETALAELNRLRDAGLISAEEYEAKRTQILERL